MWAICTSLQTLALHKAPAKVALRRGVEPTVNQEHYDNLLKGAQHWNAWVDAQGRGFEAKLEMSYLQDEDLAGANLDNAKMSGVVLSDADLTKASFASVDLSRATI